MNILKFIDQAILSLLKAVTITCFVILTVLVSANVFVRFFPIVSLHWFDEIIELVVAALIFYGSAALWITKEHFSVGDWIGKRLATRPRHAYRMALELLALVFVLVYFYYSYELADSAVDVTNAFAIPKWILYSCLPVSGAIMIIYSIKNVIEEMGGILRHQDSQGDKSACAAISDRT
jgi:TRAP-type C4-dicarboxylate transport system permease small subunit